MFEQLNQSLFLSINNFAGANNLLDYVLVFIAKDLPYLFIIILIYLWFFKGKNIKNIVLFSGYATTLGIAINFIISFFYQHNRPFVDHLGLTLIKRASDSSFPSDHTTFMISLALPFIYFKETRILGIILSTLGLFGGLLRIYTGVHYPFDIVGSIIVSIFATLIILLSKKQLQAVNNWLIQFYQKNISSRIKSYF